MTTAPHDRLGRIFLEAGRKDPGARAQYLDDACAGEPALRAEVEALLAVDDECDSVVVDGAGARFLARELARAGDLSPRPAEPMPERIGRYRILRLIGEGGMGAVYEAEQDDPRRRVALKVIRGTMVTEGLLARFRFEAHVLGHLRHPGIAQIYEAGTDAAASGGAGGRPFFAMELVEGVPLLEYADEHGLGTAERLELIARICDALHHAHQKGVLHRDLKPANILVTGDGTAVSASAGTGTAAATTGQPKILDFGVARATDADLQTVTLQTRIGELVGTVPYMSPEQAAGDPDAIDTRSDIYGIGVVAYELLAGRLPHAIRGKHVHEAVRIIREEEPPGLGTIDRRLRGDVETIVATAMKKDVTRRYQSAAELAADIRRYVAGEPIQARPPSAAYQLRMFTRRHTAVVGGVAATVLMTVIGAGVATGFGVAATNRAREAERAGYISSIAAAHGALAQSGYRTAATHLDGTPPRHRGWEYDYLRAQLDRSTRTWEPGPLPVVWGRAGGAPVFDPAGQHMFAVLSDRSIGVWDVATGRFQRAIRFAVSENAVWRVAMHGPTMRFAASSPGGELEIRDLQTGERVGAVPGPRDAQPLAWSPDGRRLLLNDAEGASIWDGQTLRPLGPRVAIAYPGHLWGSFDPAGERVAVNNAERITIFDAATGAVLRERRGSDQAALSHSPDGRWLLALGLYGNDFLLDAETLEEVAELHGHRDAVSGYAWVGPGSSRFVTTSQDGMLQIRDAGNRSQPGLHATGMSVFPATGMLPGGRSVIVAADRIREFPVDDLSVLRGHRSFVYRLAFSPDGTRLASSAFGPSAIHVWDVASGRSVLEIPTTSQGEKDLAFSGDMTRLVMLEDGRTVRQFDLRDGSELPPGTSTATAVANPLTRFLEAQGPDRGPLETYPSLAHSATLVALASTADASVAEVGLYDRARCSVAGPGDLPWPMPGAEPLHRLQGHDGRIWCVAFSPDGTRLATGGADGTVRLWDTASFEQLLVLTGHESYVMDVAFSPDGTLLASASGDRTVRLWDTTPRHERRAMAGTP